MQEGWRKEGGGVEWGQHLAVFTVSPNRQYLPTRTCLSTFRISDQNHIYSKGGNMDAVGLAQDD